MKAAVFTLYPSPVCPWACSAETASVYGGQWGRRRYVTPRAFIIPLLTAGLGKVDPTRRVRPRCRLCGEK
jgi:hypothetical protein